jgi:hypothetical protein
MRASVNDARRAGKTTKGAVKVQLKLSVGEEGIHRRDAEDAKARMKDEG